MLGKSKVADPATVLACGKVAALTAMCYATPRGATDRLCIPPARDALTQVATAMGYSFEKLQSRAPLLTGTPGAMNSSVLIKGSLFHSAVPDVEVTSLIKLLVARSLKDAAALLQESVNGAPVASKVNSRALPRACPCPFILVPNENQQSNIDGGLFVSDTVDNRGQDLAYEKGVHLFSLGPREQMDLVFGEDAPASDLLELMLAYAALHADHKGQHYQMGIHRCANKGPVVYALRLPQSLGVDGERSGCGVFPLSYYEKLLEAFREMSRLRPHHWTQVLTELKAFKPRSTSTAFFHRTFPFMLYLSIVTNYVDRARR